MKQQSLKTRNIIQLLVSLVVLILISYVGSAFFFRLDLTTEKRYTLKDATKETLRNLPDVVYVEVYLDGKDLPPGFKQLQRATREMLDEFRACAGGRIEYRFTDPTASGDAKLIQATYDEVMRKGVKGINIMENTTEGKSSQKTVLPGALIRLNQREVAVNLLKNNQGVDAETNLNNSIQSLEYEFMNGFKKLTMSRKPRIAFLEGHGELTEIEIWDALTALSEYYDIEKAYIGGEGDSLMKYKALILAKPRQAFTEADKYAIDQYIMNGGNTLWLVDGTNADLDSLALANSALALATEYGIEDQLFRYGARINPVVLQDLICAPIGLAVEGNNGPAIQPFPWYYAPVLLSDNRHVITRFLNALKTDFISSVDTVGLNPDVKRSVLLTSSKTSLELSVPVRINLDDIAADPDIARFNRKYIPVAVLLEGMFESVYTNRKLPDVVKNPKAFVSKGKPARMIVAGDGDIIRNDVIINSQNQYEPLPLGYDRTTKVTYGGNLEFILNAMNYLCDDEGLMELRLRELKMRLLDKKRIQAERLKWQLANMTLPVLLIVVFGIVLNTLKRRKYTR